MNNLYYGMGDCSVQGGVRLVEIKYNGKVKITDKTGFNHRIRVMRNMIVIFPLRGADILSDLFEYEGEFKITGVRAIGVDGNFVQINIKKQMHYSELINTKSEDITLNSEDLSAGISQGNPVLESTVDNDLIEDLQSTGNFYFSDGSPYTGLMHFHISTGNVMTGATHTKDSQVLYVLQLTGDLVQMGEI